MNHIGRLIRTTSDTCPDCESKIQIRERIKFQIFKGENIEVPEHYTYCPNCEEEVYLKRQKNNWKSEIENHRKGVHNQEKREKEKRKNFQRRR